jgi:hypothetical protein
MRHFPRKKLGAITLFWMMAPNLSGVAALGCHHLSVVTRTMTNGSRTTTLMALCNIMAGHQTSRMGRGSQSVKLIVIVNQISIAYEARRGIDHPLSRSFQQGMFASGGHLLEPDVI